MGELKQLNQGLSPILSKYKLFTFEVPDGGVTVDDGQGSFFDLKKPTQLKFNRFDKDTHVMCVKRVAISLAMFAQVIENNQEEQLIDNIARKFEEETGCTNYTFERPDGGDYIRLLEESHGVEIRICGYRNKGE